MRLLDTPELPAERALERLVDAQLLETLAPGRYQPHDLLRLYARELVSEQHGEQRRVAALDRGLRFYLGTTWQALAVLRPGDLRLSRIDSHWTEGGLMFASQPAAVDWLKAECCNLRAAIQQAAATPGVPAEIAVHLAQGLTSLFWLRPHWDG